MFGRAAVPAPREQLVRRHVLVPLAERTGRIRRDVHGFEAEIGGTLAPLGGDDDPAAGDGIFSQFGHRLSPGPKDPAYER